MAYNKAQWRSSFEDQLSLLRPHLSLRLLDTMSLRAWGEYGTKDVDPVTAAKAESKRHDEAKGQGPKSGR